MPRRQKGGGFLDVTYAIIILALMAGIILAVLGALGYLTPHSAPAPVIPTPPAPEPAPAPPTPGPSPVQPTQTPTLTLSPLSIVTGSTGKGPTIPMTASTLPNINYFPSGTSAWYINNVLTVSYSDNSTSTLTNFVQYNASGTPPPIVFDLTTLPPKNAKQLQYTVTSNIAGDGKTPINLPAVSVSAFNPLG